MVVGCPGGMVVGCPGGMVVGCLEERVDVGCPGGGDGCSMCWGGGGVVRCAGDTTTTCLLHWCTLVYRSADGIVLCYGQCSTSSLNLEVNLVVNVEDFIRPYILSRLLDVYTSDGCRGHVCVLCLGATTLHPVVCL